MLPKQEFLDAIAEIAESVYDFHDRFEVEYLEEFVPEPLTIPKLHYDDAMSLLTRRILLQIEEIGELSRALNKGLFENAFEEAADILYIALGTIVSSGGYGIDACQIVAEKNNNKTLDNTKLSAIGKVIKK